jgi:hypothetical protein
MGSPVVKVSVQSSIGMVQTIGWTLPLDAMRLGVCDLPTVAGIAAAAVGITVLLGWLLGLEEARLAVGARRFCRWWPSWMGSPDAGGSVPVCEDESLRHSPSR